MPLLADFLAAVQTLRPQVALVLGSGLGTVPQHFDTHFSLPFGEVPGLVATSVVGHSGSLAVGTCRGTPLLVFHGRLHFYEGHPWERVARPIEFAAELGIRQVILTNAAGGIHEQLQPGSLMLIRDHLFLQNPESMCAVRQGNGSEHSSPYSSGLNGILQTIACRLGKPLLEGIYAAVTGPCYETPAEIRALRAIGADAVGMSTAYEALTAQRLGLNCIAISCITNRAAGLSTEPLNHREVLAEAARQAERLSELIEALLHDKSFTHF